MDTKLSSRRVHNPKKRPVHDGPIAYMSGSVYTRFFEGTHCRSGKVRLGHVRVRARAGGLSADRTHDGVRARANGLPAAKFWIRERRAAGGDGRWAVGG